ncbi:MAG: glycosyltransferase family 39 protein [Thermoanaerobaculia bacterium]
MIFLALLPVAVFGLVTSATRRLRSVRSSATLRDDLLLSSLGLGVSIGLGTEILGAFHALTFLGVLGFWAAGAAAATAAVLLAYRWRRNGPPEPVRAPRLPAAEGGLLAGIALLALALFVVAALAPPQSSDSIGYHMSRVMHWIQNRTLSPYPSSDPAQLFDPPFAEIVRLHFHLLTGSDRSGGLLQWIAAMGALLAASLVARDLGGGRRAQIFAGLFAATLPIGIAQATSGKNDWVAAFWLLALVHFSGAAKPRGLGTPSAAGIVAACAAAGLEVMTKVTAWFFALPMIVLAVLRGRGVKPRKALGPLAAGLFLAGALVFPFLARNLAVFGSPVADPGQRANLGVKAVTPSDVASNAVRNAVFQFGSKSPAVNRELLGWTSRVLEVVGASPFDPRTTSGRFDIWPPTKVEEVVGSPLHIFLLGSTGIGLLGFRRLRAGGPRLGYFASIVAGYLLFCAAVKWQPPNCRLLMPLLVLSAPVVGVAASDLLGSLASVLGAGLLLAAVPFAVGTVGRPLTFERGKGVLATSRFELYFARCPELRAPYEEAARTVRSSGIRNLGVAYSRVSQSEYLLWMLLRDARPRVRIENVRVRNPSARIALQAPFRDFRPELVVLFVSSSKPEFPSEMEAAGIRYGFVRNSGSAGFYVPEAAVSGAGPRPRI